VESNCIQLIFLLLFTVYSGVIRLQRAAGLIHIVLVHCSWDGILSVPSILLPVLGGRRGEWIGVSHAVHSTLPKIISICNLHCINVLCVV
jgi:hypothetical protein